jgi:hypothetical protein
MANFRYFAEVNGETVRLPIDKIDHRGKALGGTFGYHEPTKTWVKVTRAIEFKSSPSLHQCDDRCTHARGHKCECSCGGANHGKHS